MSIWTMLLGEREAREKALPSTPLSLEPLESRLLLNATLTDPESLLSLNAAAESPAIVVDLAQHGDQVAASSSTVLPVSDSSANKDTAEAAEPVLSLALPVDDAESTTAVADNTVVAQTGVTVDGSAVDSSATGTESVAVAPSGAEEPVVGQESSQALPRGPPAAVSSSAASLPADTVSVAPQPLQAIAPTGRVPSLSPDVYNIISLAPGIPIGSVDTSLAGANVAADALLAPKADIAAEINGTIGAQPLGPLGSPPAGEAPYGATALDTSEYMIGDVYVTLVLMESNGSASTEDWTAAEINQVKMEVQEGLTWWETTLHNGSWHDTLHTVAPQPAPLHNLAFHLDTTYADNPVPTQYEPITGKARGSADEALWINDFLSYVGYNNPDTGYLADLFQWNQHQRIDHNTEWAYTIFVVDSSADADGKFSDGIFAYVYVGGPFLAMTYDNGRGLYGIDKMGQVVAHETAHIFYALEESAAAGARYTDHSGYYNTQNLNAYTDNPDPNSRVISLMTSGFPEIPLMDAAYANHTSSPTSLEMIGWKDSDSDGLFDVLDVPLTLDGTASYNGGQWQFTGTSTVQTLDNLNPNSLGHDITTNTVDLVQYRRNGGAWLAGNSYGGYSANISQSITAAPTDIVEVRTLCEETQVSSRIIRLGAAEATVLGNGISITDGDPTPSTADDTDFGLVPQNSTPVSHTFTVRNDGTATLTLGTVAVPTGFTLTEGLSTSLAAGASDTFTVRLDATTAGTKTGEISFPTNDSDENPFNFTIAGTVTAAGTPAVTATVAPLIVAENGTANLVYTFTRSVVSSSALTVSFSVAGTATYNTDYTAPGAASFTATSGTVIIPANQTTAQVTVDPTGDTTVEPDETVLLTVTAGTGYTVGSPAAATGTILNDDGSAGNLALHKPTFASSTDGAFVPSNATDGVSYTRWSSAWFDSEWIYVDLGSVYAINRIVLQWDSLGYGRSYKLQVSEDAATWSDAYTTTTGDGGTDDITLSTLASGRYVRMLGLQHGSWNYGYSLFEFQVYGGGANAPQITALGNGLSIPQGDTTPRAADGTDWGLAALSGSPISQTFTARNDGLTTLTLGTVTVPNGFTLTEGLLSSLAPGASDTFTVRLETGTLGTKTGEISFATNDPDENPFHFTITGTVTYATPQVTVTVAPSAVAEDGAFNLVYTFTRDVRGNPLTVNFSVGGTATYGDDYTVLEPVPFSTTAGTVIIPATDRSATVTVDPTPDTTWEPPETVILTVQSNPPVYTAGTPATATGTIQPDDGATVMVTVAPLAGVPENGGQPLVYTFTRSGITNSPLTVNFSVGGTATYGVDYTASFPATGGTVTIPVRQTSAQVVVYPVGDLDVEPDESVILTVTPGTGYWPGQPAVATGWILNDDGVAMVAVTVAPSMVLEDGAPNLVYTFTRTGTITSALTVNFSVGGTATYLDDYTQTGALNFSATSGTVIIPTTGTATVTVDPKPDQAVELDESVILMVTPGTGYIVGNPSSATGWIWNDDGTPDVTVLGNGVSIADDDTTPSTADDTDWGTVVQGSAPVSHTFTVRNDGTATLTLGPVTIVPVDSGFTLTKGFTKTSLIPTDSDTFTIQLETDTVGTKSAEVTFVTNDSDENPFNFTIAGIVTAAGPEVTVLGNGVSITDGDTTPSLGDRTDWGTVVQGSAPVSHTFTVQNVGTATLTLGTGTTPRVIVPAGFTLMDDLVASLAPGASDTFTVQLETTTTGTKTGQISFATNDSDENPFNFTITGIVTPPGPPVNVALHKPAYASTTYSSGFPASNVTDGSLSTRWSSVYRSPQWIYVDLEADYTINRIVLRWSSAYAVACKLQVSNDPYTREPPPVTGPWPAGTDVYSTSTGNGSVDDITLSTPATGRYVQMWASQPATNYGYSLVEFEVYGSPTETAPEITVLGNGVSITDGATTWSTADDTDFGSVVQGGAPVSHTFTVRNDGTADLTLAPVTIVPADSGFTLTKGFTKTSLVAGASDTFTVQLDPITTGTKTGEISFTNNDTDESPFNFTITGTVTSAPVPEVTVLGNGVSITDGDTTPSTPDYTDFGSVVQGGAPVSHTFTVQNVGAADLTLGAVTVPTGFTLTEGLSTPLGAGASDTFTVQLDTATTGTKTGEISFTNNDSDENPFNFTITGTVTPAPPSVNLALHKPAYASTTYSGFPASNVTDGSLSTRWSSIYASPQWIYVDLGAVYTINRIVLRWHSPYAVAYKLQVSNDPNTREPPPARGPWPAATDVYSTSTGNGSVDDITLSTPATGRYVQMWASQPATNYGYSLVEFEVYGGGGGGAPEVNVLGNGVSITDGDTTPSTTDYTDFGSVAPGGTPVSHTFTVQNVGTASLTLGTVQVPTGFTLTEGLSTPLGAGASDTFTVQLDTTTSGTKTGEISFATNDGDENPFNFAITGTVTSAPVPEVTVLGNGVSITDGDTTPSVDDGTDWGTVVQGSAPVSHTFTVRNDGTATLTLGPVTVPAWFLLTEGLSTSLAAGVSDTFTVQMDPTTPGTKTGEISFPNNDSDENPFNFTITGTVTAPGPEVNVPGITDGDTTPVDFGSVVQGGAPVSHTFTVQNVGTADLTLGAVTVPTGFTLVEGLAGVLAPGASDTFTVQLDTTTTGTKTGEISFTNNDSDENPFNFAIIGIVTPSGPSVNLALHKPAYASTTYTGFPASNVTDGSLSARWSSAYASPQWIYVDLGAAYTINRIVLRWSSAYAVAYKLQVSNDPNTRLPDQSWPDGTTVYSTSTGNGSVDDITLSAPASGQYVQMYGSVAATRYGYSLLEFEVYGGGGGVAPEVTVLGNGVSITDGDTTPSTTDYTDFGSVAPGGTPVSHTFTVQNVGTASLTLGTVQLPTGFTLTEGLSTPLGAGVSDTFTVQLDTAAPGTKTGEISFATNDGDENPFNFAITGTVTASAVPVVTVLGNGVSITNGDLTPSTTDYTDFGSVVQGGTPVSHTFTVRNDGTASLTLGTVTVPTGFTLTEGLSTSLAAGASDTFTVQLDTATLGTKAGEVSFANNSDENPFSFAIAGTVTAGVPEITVLGNGVSITDGDLTPGTTDYTDFGSLVQGGTPVSHTFTVQNAGTAILTLGAVTVPTGFTLTEGLSTSLAAGASDTFTVQLDTATPGTKTGEISFTNDDSDENPFNFAITGTVTAAGPEVTATVAPSAVAEDGATNLVYTFTRSVVDSSALTVNFSVAGTATFSTDYTATGAASFTATSGTVVIPADQSTVEVTVDPGVDTTAEPDETVLLTVTAGTGYTIGTPAAATGTILNDDGNLALGKTAVASSAQGNFVASNVTDGNLFTRWSSVRSDPQWIYVDLGAVFTINRIVLRWETAYGKSYQLQVSNNAVDWTDVYSTTTGDGGVDDITLSAPATGQYVRMYGTVRGTKYGYSLYEFEIYG